MNVRCGVKRGAVGVVLKGYALPLWSSGPNGSGRRVGTDKSSGEQGL